MKSIGLTNDVLNGNEVIGFRLLQWFPLFFLLITPFALYLDSVAFTKAYFDLRWLVNVSVIIFFCAFYYVSDVQLRKLMLIMVPLSYLGEWIFSKWFGWYTYRLEEIPIYVPFGHAIVYGAGYVVAGYKTVIKHELSLRKLFSIVFILLFAGVTIFVEDYFSGILGMLFFWLIYRKKWQNLYFLIALCVIYIELWGTWYGCWAWEAKIGGLLPTANPPMGAVFLYGGGDVLLARIVRRWDRYKANS
ncbi:hypothetical protein [Pedobacter sp. Hv1]|uniref:hypothetical protein n=1 Tax=Pedobacter sp. Hv1 TaxID=1740090 RepID=UPI0006D889C0|nr:hypothetical protein [Pedobacter sp. Hv1]KQC01000.1 hypothetical protein AQF98_10035 [Pedobacter sp. Hv1]